MLALEPASQYARQTPSFRFSVTRPLDSGVPIGHGGARSRTVTDRWLT